ncbi:LUD domain-containing protein [Olivibacter sp. SDN3]|uniref:LutC/YkgG family protein n=1 Tax=Olivibacter sp. SDN3 TaxID=2764720 RepID=UPI001650E7EB|nr:LUD domain-containing protein [Olivibacter sp. SDN3]QNL50631.1 LUD domain-containing protein [Olivibacter sp. SDN3]
MSSRDQILRAVASAQPGNHPMPHLPTQVVTYEDPIAKFTEMAIAVGGGVIRVNGLEGVKEHIEEHYILSLRNKWHITHPLRVVSTLQEMEAHAELLLSGDFDPHTLQDVDIAIMKADLGVAENSALWVPETQVRVLPFICQHLILLVEARDILHNMHEAYALMGNGDQNFGVFIAGPSKTADIEQSLVLGAHGPRSLMVYVMD